jgi:hypothetical protein
VGAVGRLSTIPEVTPRIFCIPATSAPVVAVLRRGPSDWMHVGRWDVDAGSYEAGSWLRGTLYPQRCDLSPDGRWLSAFILKHPADWPAGSTYIAVSRLPWLHALVAWGMDGTWSRGASFVEDRATWRMSAPDVGDATPIRRRFGMTINPSHSFAVERRRGWAETADTPPRDEDDLWDERRPVRMERARPGSDPPTRLLAGGSYAAFRSGPETSDVRYELDVGGRVLELEGVQWADWDERGRLLTATSDGELQIRSTDDRGTTAILASLVIGSLQPHADPPPQEAYEW